MRFIGGKSLLLNNIDDMISNNIEDEVVKVADLFTGSGVVASHFKQLGYQVTSNDLMYMSYCLSRGMIETNKDLKLKGRIDFLNNLKEPRDYAFVYHNYSPVGDCNRMYFQPENAFKIDCIRQEIEYWFKTEEINEVEYFYLLACLISAVPYVSNITGIYGAYLKHWDKRTYNPLVLEPLPIIRSRRKCKSYNMDAVELCKIEKFDLAYIDTPYNQRQYTPNYHVLETIAKYDNPSLSGVSGMREYIRSEFCQKAKVEQAFRDLFANLKSKYAVVSYNNESLLSTEKMLEILGDYGKVQLEEFSYRRYKNKIPNNTEGLKEQLYFVDMQ